MIVIAQGQAGMKSRNAFLIEIWSVNLCVLYCPLLISGKHTLKPVVSDPASPEAGPLCSVSYEAVTITRKGLLTMMLLEDQHRTQPY